MTKISKTGKRLRPTVIWVLIFASMMLGASLPDELPRTLKAAIGGTVAFFLITLAERLFKVGRNPP